MKVKRYKKLNKSLNFFINHYGFHQPYQLLVDGTFCFAALNNKVNIADNIPRYLHGDIKLLTTQCAIIEMEHLDRKLGGALQILKKYGLHKCGHERKPIAGSKCLLLMLGEKNEKHYIIATQDRDLQERVRNIPGVPLLYFHLKTPILEHPSKISMEAVKYSGLTTFESSTINELKKQNNLDTNEVIKLKKKQKKGPNPLSCKKKMKKPNANVIKTGESKTEKEKKQRKRIRIPKHVKEVLMNK